MKRKLLKSAAFIRAAKRLVRKNQQAAADLQATLELLSENAFQPMLKTHKLKGDLADCWPAAPVMIYASYLSLSSTKELRRFS